MKHLLTFMLATLFPCIMQATPSTDTALVRLKTFVRNIDNFNRLFPQEKVYLHLDNTGYYMGDSIWYKAYVIRTDSGRPPSATARSTAMTKRTKGWREKGRFLSAK